VFPALTLTLAGEATTVNPETAAASVAVSFAELTSAPPETVAEFVTDAGALLATVTVNVIGG
jgi:hypothetical protein